MTSFMVFVYFATVVKLANAGRDVPNVSNCLISHKIDLAIIYDASESMALGQNLAILKNYIYRIVQLFDIQSDPNKGTRVAIWAYNFKATTQFDFVACKTQQHALNAVMRIRELGAAGTFVKDMFDYLATEIYGDKFGSRYTDPTVKKVAIVILDSPVISFGTSADKIRSDLQNSNIETYALVLGGNGLLAADIDPYLPDPYPKALYANSVLHLLNFTGLHNLLKSRYGCSKCLPDNPCLNNGLCKEVGLAPYYKCECILGWKGEHCEIEDPCAACEYNDGVCHKFRGQFFKCTCKSGRIGLYCHLADPCFPPPGPCKNQATCVSNPAVLNGYTCNCPGNFSGINCTYTKPCANNNACNGHPCIPIPFTSLHACLCPVHCRIPLDCSRCEQIKTNCSSNPCFNNCICIESQSHPNGFFCQKINATAGQICDISKLDIACGERDIEVRLPRKVVESFEAGVPGAIVYLSPTPSNDYKCQATYDHSKQVYVVSIDSPFNTCGTVKNVITGGVEYGNKLWMNRVSLLIDMPVPVVEFKCQYNNLQTVVSNAIRPVFGLPPSVVSNRGTFNVTLNAFKSPPGKPNEERGLLTPGSTYTVGEEVYLTAELQTKSSPSNALVVKLINCYASPDQSAVNKIDLIVNSCPVLALGVILYNNADRRSSTFGFRTFRFDNYPMSYYFCLVEVCNKNEASCKPNTNCPSTKRKRSPGRSEEIKNVLYAGPLVLLTKEERDELMETLAKHSSGIVRVVGEVPQRNPDDEPKDDLVPLFAISAANFSLILILTIVAVGFSANRKFASQQ